MGKKHNKPAPAPTEDLKQEDPIVVNDPVNTEDQPAPKEELEVKQAESKETESSEIATEEQSEGPAETVQNETVDQDSTESTDSKEQPQAKDSAPIPASSPKMSNSAATRFDGVTTIVKSALQIFEDYAKTMSGPVSTDTINTQQKRLHSTIMAVIRYDQAKDFVAAMDGLLGIVKANRSTAFSERNIFRGMSSVNMSTDARRQFEYIMTVLLSLTCGESAKDVTERIDLSLVTSTLPTGAQGDRFIAYVRRKLGA